MQGGELLREEGRRCSFVMPPPPRPPPPRCALEEGESRSWAEQQLPHFCPPLLIAPEPESLVPLADEWLVVLFPQDCFISTGMLASTSILL